MQQKLCAVFMAVFIVVFKWENSVTSVEGHVCHMLRSSLGSRISCSYLFL